VNRPREVSLDSLDGAVIIPESCRYLKLLSTFYELGLGLGLDEGWGQMKVGVRVRVRERIPI
jgi:hypothetical protein